MSVWVSRLVLDDDWPGDGPAPIVYRQSHVIPSQDDPRGGYLGTAHLPGFITRDGADDHGDGVDEDKPWWPFLRLSVLPAQRPDGERWCRLHELADSLDDPNPTLAADIRAAADAEDTIVLDVAQVDALIADLTAWRAGVDEDRT